MKWAYALTAVALKITAMSCCVLGWDGVLPGIGLFLLSFKCYDWMDQHERIGR